MEAAKVDDPTPEWKQGPLTDGSGFPGKDVPLRGTGSSRGVLSTRAPEDAAREAEAAACAPYGVSGDVAELLRLSQ
jgi:hypothetical protein